MTREELKTKLADFLDAHIGSFGYGRRHFMADPDENVWFIEGWINPDALIDFFIEGEQK